MQLLLPKVKFLPVIFFFLQIYKAGSPSDELSSTTSWGWPSSESLNQPLSNAHINTGDHKCHSDHTCHGDWTHMHSNNLLYSRHLQWLRVQHVKGQTGDLCSIYKSMAAGARLTESDERGGEWRPVPLVLPEETWVWTQPGRTDLPWTDSAHDYGIKGGIYTTDWQTLPFGVQANGYNYFLYQHIWLLSSHWGQRKSKKQGFGSYYEQHIPVLLRGKSLCFFVFLVGCVSPAWEYHEIINRRWLRRLIPVPLIHQRSHHHQSKRTRDLRNSL